MSLEAQMDKLSAVYAEKSDGELLALIEQREGLTEMAQQALAGVMRERGLGVREEAEVEASVVVEGGDVVGESEGLIYLFHDAFEAREAIRHLTAAGIGHRMLDWHQVEPDREASYSGVDLGLVVKSGDAKAAVQVLMEEMGLLPGPESVAAEDDGGLVVLAMFDREEALAVARALGREGMTYLWRDGRDQTAGLPDEETIAIEVRAEDLDRSGKLVEETLAGSPGDAR